MKCIAPLMYHEDSRKINLLAQHRTHLLMTPLDKASHCLKNAVGVGGIQWINIMLEDSPSQHFVRIIAIVNDVSNSRQEDHPQIIGRNMLHEAA